MSKETSTKKESESFDASTEHQFRLQKAKEMEKQGINPWPSKQNVTSTTKDVVEQFKEGEEKKFALAGRVVSLRWHGKTAFAHLQDRNGKLQIYLKLDILGEKSFKQLEHFLDLGDWIFVEGSPFITKTGELTLKAENALIISKCLHPLPEKFHGLADVEVRYRQRYLDLISNKESAARFKQRSKIISSLRHYLEDHDFMEVETPMLHPIPGGAVAKPFVTHHNALDMELFLRIAPELYLKKLVVGGFERVFEINRSFRNEGLSTKHNPEFTTLEFYMAHQDYLYLMDFIEDMLKTTVSKINNGSMQLMFNGKIIDFEKPFERISMKDAVIKYGNFSEADLTEEKIDSILKRDSITLEKKNAALGEKIFALFEHFVETRLIQPTFIIDHPVEVSPLSKRTEKDKSLVARFELFIGGMEIANGFNELNDPFDQAERFKEQAQSHHEGDDEAHRYDANFIRALEYGLPPTVGVGVGIDRLSMLLTNTTSIRDVILFPTLRKEHR